MMPFTEVVHYEYLSPNGLAEARITFVNGAWVWSCYRFAAPDKGRITACTSGRTSDPIQAMHDCETWLKDTEKARAGA